MENLILTELDHGDFTSINTPDGYFLCRRETLPDGRKDFEGPVMAVIAGFGYEYPVTYALRSARSYNLSEESKKRKEDFEKWSKLKTTQEVKGMRANISLLSLLGW